jgi:GNAT superfamily N-acetyltransferase
LRGAATARRPPAAMWSTVEFAEGLYGEVVVAERSPMKVVPANQATWEDIEAVVGKARSWDRLCFCQRFKLGVPGWRATIVDERAQMLREQNRLRVPKVGFHQGLLAYVGGESAGWCCVEPRPALPLIPEQRTSCKKRGQDPTDDRVWVVACFVTRTPFRYSGVSRTLATAAVEFARARGAARLRATRWSRNPAWRSRGASCTWEAGASSPTPACATSPSPASDAW